MSGERASQKGKADMAEIADTAICEALADALRARRKWDEAPALLFIYRENGKIRLSGKSVIPDSGWAARPPETLDMFAAVLESAPAGMMAASAPPGLTGAAFRFEAWCVEQPADAIAANHATDMQHARMLHLHPARVEERCVWAVVRGGAIYRAAQVRGQRDITSGPADGSTGLVVRSLDRIVRALSSGVN